MYHLVITLGSAHLAMEIIADRRYLAQHITFSASNAIDIDNEEAFLDISEAFSKYGVQFQTAVAIEIPVYTH